MALTLGKALELINAAVRTGGDEGVPVAVAVVDRGGRVVAAARDERSGFINLDVARRKAVASVNFGAPTGAVLDMIKTDALLFSAVTAESELSVLPGGVPIVVDGALIGALGVAGGHYSQDQAIAEKAIAASVK